ncbi:MAG: hypothetical protein DBX59_09840 [Bacillota bacterium]|nr:MAG: hypothetical protein DBX59_09840 [Bacillota bacterium]
MKKKKLLFILVVFIIALVFLPVMGTASAESLEDNIDEQLGNLDLSGIEDYVNSLTEEEQGVFSNGFLAVVKDILNGNAQYSVGDVFQVFFRSVIEEFKLLVPHFAIILAIAVLCTIVSSARANFLSESIKEMVFYVCIIAVIVILAADFGALVENSKNTIQKLTNLSQIMLPVIITLMIAGGGTASAALYKPAVAFLTNGISGIFLNVLIPVVGLTVVFSVLSSLSSSFKLNNTQSFLHGLIKWLIGLSVTVFAFFMTAQGLSSAVIDGVSFRAAKYAITNSIPLVGGLLKDGFDLVLAGTVLIKNAVGLSAVFLIFSIILQPVIHLLVFQLTLKLFAALAEPVSDGRISALLASVSKSVSYLLAIVLAIGLMMFISFLLLIISANAFI